jgi:hypothetical protein
MLYAPLKPNIYKLGHVAYYYGKNETAKEPGESNLKPEKGDFKGN